MSVLISGATFRHQLENQSFLFNILSKEEKNKRKRTFNGNAINGDRKGEDNNVLLYRSVLRALREERLRCGHHNLKCCYVTVT